MKENEKLIEIQNMDFESAFTALQENITKLESEELSLEEALSLYKFGQALANRCADLLEKAELQVRTLTTDSPQSTETENNNHAI